MSKKRQRGKKIYYADCVGMFLPGRVTTDIVYWNILLSNMWLINTRYHSKMAHILRSEPQNSFRVITATNMK